jgi:hypothetical protein
MEPFFALLLILGIALTASHSSNERTEPGPIASQEVQTPATCPEQMKQPLVRDLTVPFEQRVYLLPSGKTCRPRSFATNEVGASQSAAARNVPAEYHHAERYDAHSHD